MAEVRSAHGRVDPAIMKHLAAGFPEILLGARERVYEFRISNIVVREQLRGLNETFIEQLMASIAVTGQIDPIVLMQNSDFATTRKATLVAGRHRLEALRRAGYETISAKVLQLDEAQAALLQIDSNLIRSNLSPAETAWHLYLRKQLFEAIHGRAKAIGARAANEAMGRLNANDNLSVAFSATTAALTNQSTRSIQRAVKRAEVLGNEILRRVQGTPLDQGAFLDALMAVPHEDRDRIVADAEAGKRPTSTTGGARKNRLSRQKTVDSPAGAEMARYSLKTAVERDGFLALKHAWDSACASSRAVFRDYINRT